jgi:hypothetical protein
MGEGDGAGDSALDRRSLCGMKKKKPMTIPKFSNEAEEARWWGARRSEIQSQIRANLRRPILAKRNQLATLADRVAAEINQRASKMTSKKRANADSETKRIADRVRRRTL